jgi:hypothetical protein
MKSSYFQTAFAILLLASSAKAVDWAMVGSGTDIKVYDVKDGKRYLSKGNKINFNLERKIYEETQNLGIPEKIHTIARIYADNEIDVTREEEQSKACARFVSEVLYRSGVFAKKEVGGDNDGSENLMNSLGEKNFNEITDIKDLKQGDIILFKNKSSGYHCAIYDSMKDDDILVYGEPGRGNCVRLETKDKSRFIKAYESELLDN